MIVFIKVACILILCDMVQGYYCEYNVCTKEQYCCGVNQCCDYVYSLWYFWVGLVLLVILVSACGGLFRYYYRHHKNGSATYSSLPSHIPG